MKLRNYENGRGCTVSTERSRVTGRTVKVIKHNVQSRTVFTKIFGSINLEASVRDFRTINKYKSFENFLLSVKSRGLSDEVLKLKKRLMDNLSSALELQNIESLLSHANADKGIKQKMTEHINSLYGVNAIAA
jgi:hypothetical protein